MVDTVRESWHWALSKSLKIKSSLQTDSTYYIYICIYIFFYLFSVALRPNADHGLLILEVSTSHTTTHHSRSDSFGRVISSSRRPVPDNTQHSQQTNIHDPGGIRTHDLSRRAARNLRLRPRGYWDRLLHTYIYSLYISVKCNIVNPKRIYVCLQYFTTAVGSMLDLWGRPDVSGELATSIFRLTWLQLLRRWSLLMHNCFTVKMGA